MIITWQVDDGYAGGMRPHATEIDDDEFEGLSDDEIEEIITEAIVHHFNDIISWHEISRDE